MDLHGGGRRKDERSLTSSSALSYLCNMNRKYRFTLLSIRKPQLVKIIKYFAAFD
jgi:hypothetical protein